MTQTTTQQTTGCQDCGTTSENLYQRKASAGGGMVCSDCMIGRSKPAPQPQMTQKEWEQRRHELRRQREADAAPAPRRTTTTTTATKPAARRSSRYGVADLGERGYVGYAPDRMETQHHLDADEGGVAHQPAAKPAPKPVHDLRPCGGGWYRCTCGEEYKGSRQARLHGRIR